MVADQPDFTSSVNVSGGSIIIEPGATVSIDGIVTANVVPKIDNIGSFTTEPGNITGLDQYNSLIVQTKLNGAAASVSDYAAFTVKVTYGVATTLLDIRNNYLQGDYFNNNAARADDQTFTVIPLRGGDACNITWDTSNTAGTLSQVILGTTEVLPYAHYTVYQRVSNSSTLAANSAHSLGGTGSQFPIPVTSRPVRVYFHLDASSTVASINARLIDTVTGAQRGIWIVPKSSNVAVGSVYNGTADVAEPNPHDGWIDLPHTLTPMQITTDSHSGSAVADLIFDEAGI